MRNALRRVRNAIGRGARRLTGAVRRRFGSAPCGRRG